MSAIEQHVINGRPALVAYINDRFEPVEQADATRVKVTFTDEEGGAMFLVPTVKPKAK